MPLWLQALLWGAFAGGALLIGAWAAWHFDIPRKAVGTVMAFGSGVLISALAFELVGEAHAVGGLWPTVGGFLGGALAYVGSNALLVRFGAEHRRRGRPRHGSAASVDTDSRRLGGNLPVGSARHLDTAEAPPAATAQSGGVAIAVGALLDGIPESIVLGLGLVGGASVNPTMLAAIFISNVPEGLASTADMKRAGKTAGLVFAIWASIAALSGLASFAGYTMLQGAPGPVVALVTAAAAGGILAMLADTMIPEAFEEQHMLTGLIASLGFLTALILHHTA